MKRQMVTTMYNNISNWSICEPLRICNKKILEYIPCLGIPSIFLSCLGQRTKCNRADRQYPVDRLTRNYIPLLTLFRRKVKKHTPMWDQNLQFLPVKTISTPVTSIWVFPPHSRWIYGNSLGYYLLLDYRYSHLQCMDSYKNTCKILQC